MIGSTELQMPYIIDSTLRDGEQAPGVVFTDDEKVRIAQMLDILGIDEIEAGIPAMGKKECQCIKRISRLNLNARICVWSRALISDIEKAASTEAEAIHIAFPISDIQLTSMNKEWSQIRDAAIKVIESAKSHFRYVSIGAQDASRCQPERLIDFLSLAENLNIHRIRIADTVGVLTPLSTMKLVQTIKCNFPTLTIDFHGHNDFGMASANAITAFEAGASALSVTVNGLGERAGNAALEEVMMAIVQLYAIRKYQPASLFSLCQFVSHASQRPIPEGKAISGKMAFSHESGIHAKSSLQNVHAFQAFDGALIGRESSKNLFGKHSGRGALIDFLNKQNIQIQDSEISILINRIHEIAQKKKRNVYPSEILSAYKNLQNF